MATTALTYFWRGFVYSLHALFALLAGWFMGPAPVDLSYGAVVLILLLSSIYFSIAYVISFDTEPSAIIDPERTPHQTSALWVGFALLLVSAFATIEAHRIRFNAWPTASLILLIGVHIIVLAFFAWYLRFSVNEWLTQGKDPLIRHRLVWPIVLTVAVNIYCGIHLHDLSTSIVNGWPLTIVVGYVVLAEALRLTKGPVILSTAVVLALLTAPVIAHSIGYLQEYADPVGKLADALFAVAVAAYLAAFESWRIASFVCRRDVANGRLTGARLVTDVRDTAAALYYTAALAGLIVAGLLLPFYYVFSASGTIFIVGGALHGTFVLYFWTQRGVTVAQLADSHWVKRQNIAGIAFLVVVTLDAGFRFQPSEIIPSAWLSWLLIPTVAAPIAVALGSRLAKDSDLFRFRADLSSFENLRRLTTKRLNSIRVLAIGAFAAALLLAVVQYNITERPVVASKIDWAIYVYCYYAFFAGVVQFRWSYRGTPDRQFLFHQWWRDDAVGDIEATTAAVPVTDSDREASGQV